MNTSVRTRNLVGLFSAILAFAALAITVGCGSGETSQADVKHEVDQMKTNTPSNVPPAPESTDTVSMGGPGGTNKPSAPASGGGK